MFAKLVLPCTTSDKNLTEFKQLYAIGGDEVCPSTVYYLEPSGWTSRLYRNNEVLELLLHTCYRPKQSDYMLQIGDGKTYTSIWWRLRDYMGML